MVVIAKLLQPKFSISTPITLLLWLWMTTNHSFFCSVLFWSAVLHLRTGHCTEVISPSISVMCHSDWSLHGKFGPSADVVYQSHTWSSSPASTGHWSLHNLYLCSIHCFPMIWPQHAGFLAFTKSISLFTLPARTRKDSLVFAASAVWTQLQTRQDSFVLSRPSFQFPSFTNPQYIWDWTVAN